MKLLEQPGPSTLALHLWMKSSNTMNLQYMNEPWHRLSRGENMRNDRNGSRGLRAGDQGPDGLAVLQESPASTGKDCGWQGTICLGQRDET